MPIPRSKVVRALGLDSAAVHVICLKWKVDRGSVTSWHRVVELTCTRLMHMALPDLYGNPKQGTPGVQNCHLLNPISATH